MTRPSNRWLGWSCALAFCVGMMAAPAQAQELSRQDIALTYEVEPSVWGCPGILEFQAIIANELGYDPCRADASLRVGVRIRSAPAGIEGTIAWGNSKGHAVGERRFSAPEPHCRQLAASMGFAVAVQLQLMANERASEPTTPVASKDPIGDGDAPLEREAPQRVHGSEVVAKLSVQSFRVRSARTTEKADWLPSLGVGLSLGAGLAPTAVGQGRVFASLRRRWLGFELAAEATTSSTKRQDYGGGFQHELMLGTFAACYWQEPVAACGIVKFGRLQAQGSGVDIPASPRGFVAQTGPRLAYELGLGRHLAVLGHVEALWLFTPWTVNVNHQAVWTMPRIAAIVGLDVAARFP